jgi:hypothetical protein
MQTVCWTEQAPVNNHNSLFCSAAVLEVSVLLCMLRCYDLPCMVDMQDCMTHDSNGHAASILVAVWH